MSCSSVDDGSHFEIFMPENSNTIGWIIFKGFSVYIFHMCQCTLSKYKRDLDGHTFKIQKTEAVVARGRLRDRIS